ncbi:hypothetical protein [Desulfosediminicola flagellatus]|uniref:hypothetical protein n=1 Tax=Desulfosediminicola flagellatus TaxID=2569541 RepID=UPI0010AC5E67|nr:hypothetical protein [Desulfosediminicola flagellatus]
MSGERKQGKLHILFTICDHYEPYWNKVDRSTAYSRVMRWLKQYQAIAEKHTDSFGRNPKHCFFYPEEEYEAGLLEMVKEICDNGFGETEIHLHHDNDTADNLRLTLLDFKRRLAEEHGLLSVDRDTNEIKYGFIHGNWALDNSRPDGKWCGVNNEITVLQDTGCYADFTMPSAPSDTQTSTINSIYYAIDDPNTPKSHDRGRNAFAGESQRDGLLCIQGPLAFNTHNRKFGILPRIENGRVAANSGVGVDRLKVWDRCNIHVAGRPDIVFVKLYSHGTQEKDMDFFFDKGGLDALFTNLENYCQKNEYCLHYVSARNMYNVIKGLERENSPNPQDLYDYELKLIR